MSSFHAFLREQIERAGFSTGDVLVSFLPLMHQVIQTHDDGGVAPLDGLDALHIEGARIWYAEADERPQRRNMSTVRRMLRKASSGVDVVGERRIVFDVDDGVHENRNLQAAEADDHLQRPAYLPGYLCWEHQIQHHDPATDVFSLGLILASLACGLDLTEEQDHERFITHRRNLFRINPALHPVLARSIVVMTELDRHHRPQDLPALLMTLENYRDQAVDFETDLARDPQLLTSDRPGKRQVILSKLQERLFEINRRNRLLQFRSNMQTVNLTQSSIPLSFDAAKIREDQVLTWSGAFRDQLVKQKPVSLNRFLNFREAVYLPGTLDRIRSEARRDETEYGFAQLRLIICFLRWADLKASPPERYESPLLLVPVKLDVKKGIHDRYSLTAVDSVAEVNPVVRHLFKQLYDIDLPDQVDLATGGADAFCDDLKQRIKASDDSVDLACIKKPRIELIHEKARRRLDQFRKRARLSGRGIRHFMDLDYSYDPINYHPLGIRIFENFIIPARTHLEGVISTTPPKRRYMVADDAEEAVVEAEQQFYHLKTEGDDNPFNWEFDLCSVTLANLKYRRMSLVRDYTRLVADNTENAAFEATFSITPADRLPNVDSALPLEDRFHVVQCDPTQGIAITHARSGDSYIIQGPPGTGKSQTITNLIADYVVRGQRVLFVCEKRAAIDVVYHRLKQQGLQELCCLIHDSQADKKQFVADLKETYDAFLAEAGRARDRLRQTRDRLVERLQTALTPIAAFSDAMTSKPPSAGMRLRSLLDRLMELRSCVPNLVPREWERVPDYVEFVNNHSQLSEFAARLKYVQRDEVLAHHPLCLLSADVADAERPMELVEECLAWCLASSGNHDSSISRLESLMARVEQLQLPSEVTSSVAQLQDAVQYAQQADFLAEYDLLSLLDPESETTKNYTKRLRKLARRDKAVAKAQTATTYWNRKLSSTDTGVAFQQARQLEGSIFRFLKPTWWRLRRTLNEAYDFSQHAVKPRWSQILAQLDHEHEKLADRAEVAESISDEFDIHLDVDRFHRQLLELRTSLKSQPGPIQSLNRHVVTSDDGAKTLRQLAAVEAPLAELCQTLDRFLDGYRHRSLSELRLALMTIDESTDQLPDYLHCLASLKPLPDRLTSAIRTLPLTLQQLEAAAAEHTLQTVYRDNRELARFDGEVRSKQITEVATICDKWLRANADAVREFVRQRFNDHVTLSAAPVAQLTPEQKQLKTLFNRGRREVEHEFSKSMRYKAIRELAAGDSGVVIRDLKPVWLMSPLSVSDTLPLNADNFDVVIFDEASQITLEEAIPSLFRANQTIVVGDEMQLPPTSFFATKRSDDDEDLSFEEEGEVVQYDLNSSSFLNHSSRNLPTRMLGWHYRSRSESLISFSNHAFYCGRLLTVPEERLYSGEHSELLATCAQNGVPFAAELLFRPVSFHLMQHGIYEKRRNTAEAEYIAEVVRELLTKEAGHSIGIVAFSEAQQEEIERSLRALADEDSSFAELLDAELEREEDGQFMGLLVKNLENIQGDERDIIILSVCYGPDPTGKVRMNFGPINMSGGEKRLNVAFSRAKHRMALVASMRSIAITNDYNDGANCLKTYLKYAEACSAGHASSVSTVLQSLSGRADSESPNGQPAETLVDEIAEELTQQGFRVDRHVGQSHFRCDLAVCCAGDHEYRLGILTDGRSWYGQIDLLERELMKPELLQSFGWQIQIVLARDWYHDRALVLNKLKDAINEQP